MRTRARNGAGERHQQGAALLVAMLMLVLTGLIGLASLETVTRDRQVAGFQSRARAALYAAEAGLATARDVLLSASLPNGVAALVGFHPALPGGSLGDAGIYPYGLPGYASDPDAANPIDWLGSGGPCDEWVMSIEAAGASSQAIWRESLWDLRASGQTADGADSRIQATGTRCYAFN